MSQSESVTAEALTHQATETHHCVIEGEIEREYYDCPECGSPLCEWMDCPECGWYDEAAWKETL